MNEQVLGHFLRYKRTHAVLAHFPVTAKRKRRTPGLTRDEVAAWANVSVDWYSRIEQGRAGVTPSGAVLANLGQVLQFSQAEMDYVFNLIGLTPPLTHHTEVAATTLAFIDAQLPTPALIMDQQFTILAANASYQALFGPLTTALQNNWLWRTFHQAQFRTGLTEWAHYAAYATAVFRQYYSLAPESPFWYQVYTSIKADSIFNQTWAALTVTDFKTQPLLFNLPNYGELYLLETVLQLPATEQYVVFENAGDAATLAKLKSLATAT